MTVPELDTPVKRALFVVRVAQRAIQESGLTPDDIEDIRQHLRVPAGLPPMAINLAGRGNSYDELKALCLTIDTLFNFLRRLG
jgi:hypothetical protein